MAGDGKHRKLDDVERMLDLAKLEHEELKNFTQPLNISDDFQNDAVRLMEIEPGLLKDLLAGERFVIKGERDDAAVLCTNTKTYEIKEAETSNSLLILPDWSWPEDITDEKTNRVLLPRKITGIFHSYFELRSSRPRLKRLKMLLEENPYRGKEYEDINVGSKYTFSDLANSVQASDRELEKALSDIQACLIDGFWRSLDFEYHSRVFTFILNLVDSNSWSLDEIPEMKVLNTLEELEPREIVEQVFHWYAEFTGQTNEEGDKLYRLVEGKVCRFYAEIMLRPVEKFNLEEFLENWQKCVPEGMRTNLGQLKGLALTDYNSIPNGIFLYPLYNLSEDINERFSQLFNTRSKWTFEEICPYIQDLTTATQDTNVLLTKYTRGSQEKGVKMYSSK